MNYEYDICIIGSGAGAGPAALTLSEAGHKVVVLEKGPWYKEKDFSKDELVAARRSVYTPNLRDEPQVVEDLDDDGNWQAQSSYASGRDFWNGSLVGGSSNFMSGYFHRLKPEDFRLLSEFGTIEGANMADWPISYKDLEPYYSKVEHVVGVSGKFQNHPFAEPRSNPEFPYPPTVEHPISGWFDKACKELGYHPLVVSRAILPFPALNRKGCEYTNYCGSYGCSTAAKGSSRAALLDRALLNGNLDLRPLSKVYRLESDQTGKVRFAHYHNSAGESEQISAKIFIVAAQAIETARLLLLSPGEKHPAGLGNRYGNVGKNIIFSAGGVGMGNIPYGKLNEQQVDQLKVRGLFVNRALEDWYFIDDSNFSTQRVKGGLLEFMFRHANPVSRANSEKWSSDGLLWGNELKDNIKRAFTQQRDFKFEVFNDWLPTDNCFVTLDARVKDRWKTPVAKIRIGYHEHDLKIGNYLAKKGEQVLEKLGARDIYSSISGSPPPNLMAGGCRFGSDPQTTVLDKNCRVHDVENLYITDGSFMPTGGSVPYTFTIYANSFRVADEILKQL